MTTMSAMSDTPDPLDVTRLLIALNDGQEEARAALLPVVYDELRRRAEMMMRRESAGHTLQPTALVHEAYMKLVDQDRVSWANRGHFFAIAARQMRRILVDHARGRQRQKRGGDQVHVPLEDGLQIAVHRDTDVLAVDQALKRLASLDARQAQIVEMRFFGGLTVKEIADALGVSKRTIEAEWTMIKAWLRRELSNP